MIQAKSFFRTLFWNKKSLSYAVLFGLMCGVFGFFYFIAEQEEDMLAMHLNAQEDFVVMATNKNEAMAPRFQAMDKKGQSYVIDAQKAALKEGDDTIILLNLPAFHMTLHNQKNLDVTAREGIFLQDKKHLSLKGGVHVKYGADTVFDMPVTEVDLNTGSLRGDQSIHGHMEDMMISAGSFEIQDRGAKIILTQSPVIRFHGKK